MTAVERRFICTGCRAEWFVAADRGERDPETCGACGGVLVRLFAAGESRPAYGHGEPDQDPTERGTTGD